MFMAMNSNSMERRNRSSERCLDSQLWHACAGAMVQMPPINTKVFYFPQGHAEHANGGNGKLDFAAQNRVPPLIPCRVTSLKYMAEPDTDEVFVKMSLRPLTSDNREFDFEDDKNCAGFLESNQDQKPASFAKTLTQSDANNGGGFSVPRYCAETIFPRLDYSAEPPVQTIIAKDVHGQCWKFRHIYRGTPRRHLLTTGWSNFVNQKKLVAGDSIVFLRAENDELCVGIRRAKKGIGCGTEFFHSGSTNCWNNNNPPRVVGGGGESIVAEAVNCAVNGREFEVVYYPRASSTPEFCVKGSLVRDAMQIHWCPGMRFKMPFETEDSSRISWFMGTISSVQPHDPIRWPDSPWRLLQVVWDEPDLLQNVQSVNPWLVELVSNVPNFHISPFSPPRKKQRFLHEPDFHLFNNQQLPMPPFNNLLNSIQDSNHNSAGIQGARHAQFGLAPPDLPFGGKLQQVPDMFLGGGGFPRIADRVAQQPARPPCGIYNGGAKKNVDISCWLTMGNPGHSNIKESNNEAKAHHILLFGKLIHTEQKSSTSNSFSASTNGNSVSEGTNSQKTSNASDGIGSALRNQNCPVENSSDGGSPWYKDQRKADLAAENVNILCMAL